MTNPRPDCSPSLNMAAIYSVYTSPSHPPIPNHLPTLIVTPHGNVCFILSCHFSPISSAILLGQPSNILYSYLHTNFVRSVAMLSCLRAHALFLECGELPFDSFPSRRPLRCQAFPPARQQPRSQGLRLGSWARGSWRWFTHRTLRGLSQP